MTMNEGRGISLDQSIAIMHRLRDAGFPDDALGVVSVEFAGRRHSFAIVHDVKDDFWMLDNGKFSFCPVRGKLSFFRPARMCMCSSASIFLMSGTIDSACAGNGRRENESCFHRGRAGGSF